jgi:hypothetical protein
VNRHLSLEEIAMYNVRIRIEETPPEVRSDGHGVAVRVRRTKVRRFRSLVEAQEIARRLQALRRLA